MITVPLVDLHRHLEGAMRTSTVLDIARRAGHPLPDAPRERFVATSRLAGLLPYLDRVDAPAELVRTAEGWTRVAREVVLDAYDDGLRAVELRFSPWFVQSRTELAPEAVIDAVVEGVAQAQELVDLPVGLIGIMLRDLGPDGALPQLASILSRRDAFVAIDIAGNEAGYPAGDFAPAYAKAHEAGLRLTAHAGEAAGPASVWAAVRELGVERVGHGVRAAEDPRLMEHLAEHRIALEVAITSNVQSGAAASFAEHPVRTLLRHGVQVTLNTDNPRASNVTLSHEYDVAATRAGLTADDVETIARNAVEASFVLG
ncbi:adenosine deaminase [Pseudonocardia sp. CA-107938]|uniref:adenosine deaminase n=1 Tax=Pseudonocardia sp. CA-107938 TaxID=3240021 RepID=UPI003D91998C